MKPPSGDKPHTPHRHEPPSFPEIDDYVQSLVPARPPEVEAMEQVAREQHFPIIGPACGHLCYLVARMVGARSVFELGSGFGYSTYWFARAVKENGGGVVHHTVLDEELSARARRHLGALGLADQVEFHVAEAVATLRAVGGEFDVLFCDIDKPEYPEALAEMERRLRPGGVALFDNLLLHGAVLPSRLAQPLPPARSAEAREQLRNFEEARRGILQTTDALFRSGSWLASLLPLRDGLALAWKPR